MNFAITGHGRSGTKYLARVLNMSPTWTVLHEPGGNQKKIEDIQPRFEVVDQYGEVNSYLRWSFKQLEVERRGVIIRDPREIILSWINRNYYSEPELRLDDEKIGQLFKVHDEAFELVDRWARAKPIMVICFDWMVTEKCYLQDIAKYMGIDDLDLNDFDPEVKINRNPHHHFPTFHDLPDPWRRYCTTRYDWLRKKHQRYIP